MLSGIPHFSTEITVITKDNRQAWNYYENNFEKKIANGLFLLLFIFFWQIIRLWDSATEKMDQRGGFFLISLLASALSLLFIYIWSVLAGSGFWEALEDIVGFGNGFLIPLIGSRYLIFFLMALFAILLFLAWYWRRIIEANFRRFTHSFLIAFFVLMLFSLFPVLSPLFHTEVYHAGMIALLYTASLSFVFSLIFLYLPYTFTGSSYSLLSWLLVCLMAVFLMPIILNIFWLIVLAAIISIYHAIKSRRNEDWRTPVRDYYLAAGKSEAEIASIINRIEKGEKLEDEYKSLPGVLSTIIKSLVIIILVVVLVNLVMGQIRKNDRPVYLEGGPSRSGELLSSGIGNDDPREIMADIINMSLGLAFLVALVILVWGLVWMAGLGKGNPWLLRKRGKTYAVSGAILVLLVLAAYALAAFVLDSVFQATSSADLGSGGITSFGSGGNSFGAIDDSFGSDNVLRNSSGYARNEQGGDYTMWSGNADTIQSITGLGNDDPRSSLLSMFDREDSPAAISQQSEKKITLGPGETYKSAARVRQYFPETMYWQAELIAENGTAEFTLPIKDSITRWRMSALANALSGRIGAGEKSFIAFQDFFLDFEVPANLSVGDELVLPITLYNYLDEKQKIRLSAKGADWFEAVNNSAEMEIPAGGRSEAFIGLRIKRFGDFRLRIDAEGTKMADAVERTVRVLPLGRLIEQTVANEVFEGEKLELEALFPAGSIAGTEKISVKLYPTIFSQIVEGTEGILRLPSGCFEQVSSSLYPNILVLRYLKETGKDSPEIRKLAEDYISQGLQKILGYEMPGGGFSLYGRDDAETLLTAYGLFQLDALKPLMYVDQKIIDRSVAFLREKQKSDGSFTLSGHHNANLSVYDDFARNAYVIWSLSQRKDNQFNLRKSYAYLASNYGKHRTNYNLALAANAMYNIDPDNSQTKAILSELKQAVKEEGGHFFLPMNAYNHFGSGGQRGNIETSALAAIVFGRAGETDFADKLTDYIISAKAPNGNWGSTQATTMALLALSDRESFVSSSKDDEGKIRVAVNSAAPLEISINPRIADVVQILDFDQNLQADNKVSLVKEGKINTTIQVVKRYYQDWKLAKASDSDKLSIKAAFPKDNKGQTELKRSQASTLQLELSAKEGLDNAMVDISLPSGFEVLNPSLSAYVNQQSQAFDLGRYEISSGLLRLYFNRINAGTVSFEIPLKPDYVGRFRLLPARFYANYDPGKESFSEMAVISVSE
jgi:hypothetical protein